MGLSIIFERGLTGIPVMLAVMSDYLEGCTVWAFQQHMDVMRFE
jgi:hypothetical protein